MEPALIHKDLMTVAATQEFVEKIVIAKILASKIQCAVKRSRGIEDLALIIGPVVGGMLFIAIVGAFVFLVMARRRRRSEGKYKPATQEQTSPRLQLDNMIKPPPEERLI